MEVRPFDPGEGVFAGRSAIEASAGTGKTFTVAGQVTQLVADGTSIDRILVVTFTRAATAELADRVRSRLRRTARALSGDRSDLDEHLQILLDGTAEMLEERRERVEAAIGAFDKANIHTIHGFAQRVLSGLGFYSRLPADVQPSEIDADLIRAAVSDALVGRFALDPGRLVGFNDTVAIATAVMGHPDALIVPAVSAPGEPGLRAALAHQVRDDIRSRLEALGLVAYDQLLLEARDALADEGIGAAARELVRARFDAALVDESQDTDPIQWQIIEAIFDESRRLVIIGDPKQSIYAFRGADIESYLGAAERAEHRRTLPRNWRSDGPLVQALNVLFDGVTFGDPRIAYLTVGPAPANAGARIEGDAAPVVVRRLGDDEAGDSPSEQPEPLYRPDARALVAEDVAAQIVAMLESATLIDDGDDRRVLDPGDVAVLCRTRLQVDLVRSALSARNVPSVAARSGSVFTSPAAEEWRRFLHGVERPDIMTRVRLAAATSLWGLSLDDLSGLSDEEMVEIQATLRRWRDLLHDAGVPALLAAVDRHTGLAARLLGAPDGERSLTDLTHVSEAMHLAWRGRRIGSLLGWLEAEMVEAAAREQANAEESEARQRRLETDADAVQVETIHGAKGLEYPVVLAPFLWDVPRFTEAVPVYHEEPAVPGGARRRAVDVGGKSSADFAAHRRSAREEDDAEESRLLYVALTRARHRVIVWWVPRVKGVSSTKLHQILTRFEGPHMSGLIDRSGGTIAEQIVADEPSRHSYSPQRRSAGGLERARLGRRLDTLWRRVSFSSLSPDHPMAAVADAAEVPLRDDEPAGGDDAAVAGSLPLGSLPSGARFGTLVHDVLEHTVFSTPRIAAAVAAATDAAMAGSRWDFEPEALATGLTAALRTPLTAAGGPRLTDIPEAKSLKEMWFDLPIRASGPATDVREIAAVMAGHLEVSDPFVDYPETLGSLPRDRFRGFMAGAIDYVAALEEPGDPDRFVVMDFKSNIVAPYGEEPTAQHFAPDTLAVEMHRSHYVLQALLYQVALHRYLQWRLPGYDPQQHLGGAAYLFVRGMTGPDTPVVDGARTGVFWWRPGADLIVALSTHLRGEEVS